MTYSVKKETGGPLGTMYTVIRPDGERMMSCGGPRAQARAEAEASRLNGVTNFLSEIKKGPNSPGEDQSIGSIECNPNEPTESSGN